ncbi:hypothetical protein DCAR_0208032 [Daucus carota subsp. sativus]|uniref:Uncharacterized protein n=1 Tax=Daucus carota subsp. sativus TaxID=79200 RepID=A0A166E9U5_DAUCS|nr:hypothetical protein DCAR_0208032 [Daucus carota subsp. sativus]
MAKHQVISLVLFHLLCIFTPNMCEARDKLSPIRSGGEIKDGGTAYCYKTTCDGSVTPCWCCSRSHECSPIQADCEHFCVFKD